MVENVRLHGGMLDYNGGSVELDGGECWVTSIVEIIGLHGRVLSYRVEGAGLHGGIGYMVESV